MDTMQDTQQTEEFVQPGKGWAATAIVLLLACAGAWFAKDYLMQLASTWLQSRNAAAPAGADARTALMLLAMLSLPTLLCVLYASWAGLMAYRIFRTGAFPPRGYPVLVKTRVLRDGRARREAGKFIFSAMVAIGLLGFLGWALFSQFPAQQVLRALTG